MAHLKNINEKFANVGSKINLSQISRLDFLPSGEISPNLVTLPNGPYESTICKPLKCGSQIMPEVDYRVDFRGRKS